MRLFTLLATVLSGLSAAGAEFRAVRLQEATTKTGSPYVGSSEAVTEWTVITLDGAPPLELMETNATASMLFVGKWPCGYVRRGLVAWCVVPRIRTSGERLWGPVRVSADARLAFVQIPRLQEDARKLGVGIELSGIEQGPPLSSENLKTLIDELRSSAK